MAFMSRSLARTGGRGPAAESAISAMSPRNWSSSRRQLEQPARCVSSAASSSPCKEPSAYSARSSANCSCTGISSFSCCEHFAQAQQSGANSGLDRAQGLAGLGRNFGMAQAFKIRHLERAALGRRHAAQSAANFFHGPGAFSFARHVRFDRNYDICNIGFRTPLAEGVNGAVAGDHREPGGEIAAAGIEHAGIAPQLEKDLLQYVLRSTGIAQYTQRNRVNKGRVAVVKLRHGGFVAGTNCRHQGRVSRGVFHLNTRLNARQTELSSCGVRHTDNCGLVAYYRIFGGFRTGGLSLGRGKVSRGCRFQTPPLETLTACTLRVKLYSCSM